MKQTTLAALCGVIVVGGLAAAAILPGLHAGKPASAGTEAADTPNLSIGGDFTLVDGQNRKVTAADFHGRAIIVYFGYTHCPDACPTTLSDLAAALDKIPPAARARLVPVFITVDPERDTPAVMRDYVAAFGPEFVGLTGSAAQIAEAEKFYHVYAEKHPLAHGDYAMDHSSVLYVMGPDGAFRGIVDDGMKPADMAQRLQSLGA